MRDYHNADMGYRYYGNWSEGATERETRDNVLRDYEVLIYVDTDAMKIAENRDCTIMMRFANEKPDLECVDLILAVEREYGPKMN